MQEEAQAEKEKYAACQDEIEVENVTDNFKKGFHKNILIK